MSDTVIPPTPTRDEYLDNGPRKMGWLEADEPISLFEKWLGKAGETELNDSNAMSVATVDAQGVPDVRILLLKGLSEAGFVFYTNSESAKGEQLQAAGQAALCFHWKSWKRQVRVRGRVEKVSDAESDAYFAERARGSRIGAWASDQSRPVGSREEIVDAVQAVEAEYEGREVPRPPHWYGWRVVPDAIEFWQDGAFRLHDRIVFSRATDGGWTRTRLYP
ncbi:pyridoxamine 5'-phosphate oxidase [Litorimonas sp. WD9-15]|uniref:pyridoxamine 5'-phosphate oxidase n=1 Tax=Litorimonas sp. WD9-15 TaxID=3418716 RepID=UPI003D061529